MLLTELFDNPSQAKAVHDTDEYKSYTATLSDGSMLQIEFQLPIGMMDGENEWELNFKRTRVGGLPADASMKKTGEGNEFEVMATVMNVALQFMKNVKPNSLEFSAEIPHDDPRKDSRANLYRRMAQKMAGQEYVMKEHKDADYVFFTLTLKSYQQDGVMP